MSLRMVGKSTEPGDLTAEQLRDAARQAEGLDFFCAADEQDKEIIERAVDGEEVPEWPLLMALWQVKGVNSRFSRDLAVGARSRR